MNLKKFPFFFLAIFFLTSAQAEVFRNHKGKVTIAAIKETFQQRGIDNSETCLDEYLIRSRNLAMRLGFGFPVGGALGAGGTIGGAIGGAAVGAAAGGPTLAGLGLSLGGAAFGGIAGIGAVGLGTAIFGTVTGVQLGLNNHILRTIAESYDGRGRHLDTFFKKFKRRNKRKLERIFNRVTKKEVAFLIQRADQEGVLCDGTLSQKQGRLKYKLAKRKHIYKYLVRNL